MPEDLLTRIQRQLRDRLRELEGVREEYESLEQAARALGAVGDGRATRASAPRPAASPRASARRRAPAARRGGARKRAPRGANSDAILGALRSLGKGTVASEVAKRSGVGRVSSYQVLGRLEQEGLVRRTEQANGPALYSLP